MKIINIYFLQSKILKIIKFVELNYTINKNQENEIISRQNIENHEIQRIPCQNHEIHVNLFFPVQNHENYEIHRITIENHENHEKQNIFNSRITKIMKFI